VRGATQTSAGHELIYCSHCAVDGWHLRSSVAWVR
jgi:hypothetical protein